MAEHGIVDDIAESSAKALTGLYRLILYTYLKI